MMMVFQDLMGRECKRSQVLYLVENPLLCACFRKGVLGLIRLKALSLFMRGEKRRGWKGGGNIKLGQE